MTLPIEDSFKITFPGVDEKSVCVDVGCHKAQWSLAMSEKYGCKIYAFEPVQQFYQEAAKILGESRNVHLICAGVGGNNRVGDFHVKGEMSGEFEGSSQVERVSVISIGDVLEWCRAECAVLALNCEGGEMEVLEAVMAQGLANKILNILVQWHAVVKDFDSRYQAVRAALATTHDPVYEDGIIWQIWRRK